MIFFLKELPLRKKMIFGLAIYTLLFALIVNDSENLLISYGKLLVQPTHLLHDFTVTVGLSATLLNVAIHFLVAFLFMAFNKHSAINGFQLAVIGIFAGHAFFGTNLLNILPILLGMYGFAKWSDQSFYHFTSVSLFATALGPLVSFIMFDGGFTLIKGLMGILAGVLAGLFAQPLAESFLKFHQGFTIFNYGFTTGIMGMFLIILLSYFNMTPSSQDIVNTDPAISNYLIFYISGIILFFFIVSLCHFSDVKEKYRYLLLSTGRAPDDFVSGGGIYVTAFNCALMGLIYLFLVLWLGAPLNGPIVGALLTVIGFSGFGMHPKNAIPVALGVILAAFLLGDSLTDTSMILAFIFSAALAPMTGYYGFFGGLLAGFLHFNLTGMVSVLHLGLTVYNNGFSSGFVAAFLVPIFETIIKNSPYE